MAERDATPLPAPPRARGWAIAALVAGLALAWCPLAWSAPAAALGLVFAQPLLLLGWSLWRGSRSVAAARVPLAADAAGVTLLWTLAFGLLAVVLAWPLRALRDSGALVPALVLSLCAGVALLGTWRLWPAFAQAARHAQRFGALLAAATRGGQREFGRSLAITGLVFAVLALGLLLAWPGLLPPALRVPGLWLYPLFSLLAHAEIHRRADRVQGAASPELAATTATAAPAAALDAPAPRALPAELTEGTPDARLYAALRHGRVDAGLLALEAGANAHALPAPEDRDQRTLPMLAALQGDLRLLRQLIARGADLNAAHHGLTPLLAATRDSWHGRPEAVMTLLANGADARQQDGEGNTPLHHAARSTDPAVAALLLDAGAQVDTLNAERCSALWVACASGNWRLARFLIEHGAKPEPAGGQPVLLAAAGGDDDPGGVQLLLRHKARVDARGEGQRTALMQACAAGNAEIAGVLLDAGADRNAHDAHGRTPLLDAAAGAHAAVVSRLAAAKPDVRAVDAEQRNAIYLACLAGADAALLRELRALGVDAHQPDAAGRRPIDIAIEHGRWPQVSVLDPDYALPANVVEGLAEGEAAQTPRELLRDALRSGRFDAAQTVLGLGGGLAPRLLADALFEFSEGGDLTAFAWLAAHGAPADSLGDGEAGVLFRLLAQGAARQAALQRLLDRGQGVGGRGGLALFLQACLAGEHTSRSAEQLALGLLERGADAFGSLPPQDPPLVLAVRLGWQRLVDALLARGVDPNLRDARGHGAILVAASLGRETALRALIRAGAQPSARSPDGQTALGLALAAGRSDLSHWLEWRGWALPGRPLLALDLPAAAIAGDREAVQRLIALGLAVDGADLQGCTALLRAAGGGHLEIVQALLQGGADPAVSARTGATPLSAAISMRHAGVVDALLQAGADPNQALPGGVTPLMLAAALGLPEIAGRLLAQGASLHAVDDQGLGALHCAALHAFSARDRQRVLALLDLLLMGEDGSDATNRAGQTPLLLALGARAEAGAACDEDLLLAVLERLCAEGVSLDVQDQRGLSALHLAAMHGLLAVVRRLLREGANRQLRDSLGRTPYDLALLRGYVDIATEFEPARPAPSLARFLREPR
jgi:ankyrin repeat protein